MKFKSVLPALAILLMVAVEIHAQSDWPVWRGPNRNGVAEKTQTVPTTWDANKNVLWKSKVPGRGHASPIVVGNKIFLATCDNEAQTQSVVCFDRSTGKQLWFTTVNTGELQKRIFATNTRASSTVASDGKSVFALFVNHGNTQLTALDFDGKQKWQKDVGKYQGRFGFGHGSSPIIQGDNILVPSDNQADSLIAAYNRSSGEKSWQIDRPKRTSFSTPSVIKVGGKEQIVISGGQKVHSYDPSNQKVLWEADTKWQVSCGTPIWSEDMIFVSGGYPAAQTLAVKSDGSGKIVWENRVKCYEQSMLYHNGYIYAHSDKGVIYCWNAKDGTEMWKQRAEDKVSASPVLVGDNIYFTAQSGNTYVVKADPKKYTLISKNKLGDVAYASMAVVDNKIFQRVGVGVRTDKNYQEWLYCLGSK